MVMPISKNKLKYRLVKEFRAHYQLYLLILPSLAYILIFNYVPMYGVQIAFKKFSAGLGILDSPWVGLDNFMRFFSSYSSQQIILNTLELSLLNIAFSFPVPVVLALLLNRMRSEKYKRLVQTVTYAPHFISIVVIVGMLHLFLSPTTGIINKLVVLLGGEAQLFMGAASWFRPVYILSGIWQSTGWGMILYLATLAGVDPSLYEASYMDGATKWQQIRYIDVPALMEVFVIVLILRMGSIMNTDFEKVYLMQSTLNLSTSELISTYVYKVGLLQADYSYSAAVGLFNSVVNTVMLLLVNGSSKRLTGSSLF